MLEEYTPQSPVPERTLGVMIEEMRQQGIMMEEIRQQMKEEDEEGKRKEASGYYDLDDDDLLDEEGEGRVCMVDTRSSSRKELDEVDEGNSQGDPSSDLNQQLLVQLQKKELQIMSMERKMEEMMAQMLKIQSQIPITQTSHNEPEPIKEKEKEKEKEIHNLSSASELAGKEIKEMIEQQVKEAIAQSQGTTSISKGRPYPEEYDTVPYPKGFVPPSFKSFDGTGNPRQHLAHFRASCCNAGGSDALLFRQFVSSLSGVAFDWYAELPNGSVRTFNELETLFIKRFAGAQHHITVGDLVVEKQKHNEPLVDYILRWRNLSMKCEPQLQEQHAVEILLRNIHGPVAFLLKGFTIKTFEKLLNKASNLQEEASRFNFMEKDSYKNKPTKVLEKKAGLVSAVDKGKAQVSRQK